LKLTSGKAYRVVRYVLGNPEFTQREVARKTGVSLGYVNEVVNYIVDVGIVVRSRKAFLLREPVRLLEKISFDRPFSKVEVERFRVSTTSVQDTEEEVSSTLTGRGVRYAFTVFSGLRKYFEYHLSYPTVHFYVEDESALRHFERGEGSIQVVALRADLENIWNEMRVVDGFSVCDREQVVVDLFSSGVGRDAAIKFLEAS